MPLTRIIVESSGSWYSILSQMLTLFFVPLAFAILISEWISQDFHRLVTTLFSLFSEILHIIPCVLGQVGIIKFEPVEPLRLARQKALAAEPNAIARAYRRIVMKYQAGIRIMAGHGASCVNQLRQNQQIWIERIHQLRKLWSLAQVTRDWALQVPRQAEETLFSYENSPEPPVLDSAIELRPFKSGQGKEYKVATLGMTTLSPTILSLYENDSDEEDEEERGENVHLHAADSHKESSFWPSADVAKNPERMFSGRTQNLSKQHDYEAVKKSILEVMKDPSFDDGSLGPVMVRLAWHCCATYDKDTNTGGSNGATIRIPPELTDSGNTGLQPAILVLEIVKYKHPWISYADLYTFSGVVAIEEMGGPEIPWTPGRTDTLNSAFVPPNGRLPIGSKDAFHIHEVFSRMGFSEQETVCLIGAHTLGRTHKKYSGWEGKWTENPTVFDNQFFKALVEMKWVKGKVPETSRDQYYAAHDSSLMMLYTDMELIKQPEYAKWVKVYAEDCDKFFSDFAIAFGKLLELGVERGIDGLAIKMR